MKNRKYVLKVSVLFVLSFLTLNCSEAPFSSNSIISDTTDSIELPSEDPNENVTNQSVPVIMAVGHMRSSMYSCDGGESWVGYRSANDQLRCWDRDADDFDCDHDSTSMLGVTYGDQGFMMTTGWGQPGQVEVTTDALNYSVVDQGSTWAGVSYGNGVYILHSRRPIVSNDGGANWFDGGQANYTPFNARRIEFIDQGQGYFLAQAQSGDVRDALISRDNGLTWESPNQMPESCSNGTIAYSDNVALIIAEDICRSTDQGENWTVIDAGASMGNHVVYAQNEFYIYNTVSNQRHKSNDGLTWQTETFTLGDSSDNSFRLSRVYYNKDMNRFISINQGWQSWYENTRYFYSDDGLSWSEVPRNSAGAPHAHPVRAVAMGYLPASSCTQE